LEELWREKGQPVQRFYCKTGSDNIIVAQAPRENSAAGSGGAW
jgi:hypothetical protein